MTKNNLKYIITFLILYLCWAVVLPLVFKANFHRVESVIKNTTGYNVKFINPKLALGTIFHAKISAKEIDILNKNNSKALSIKNPEINIKVLPLIIGKSHIRMFEADDFSANFSLGKNLYLGDYLIQKLEGQPDIKVDRVKVNKYNISLYDKNSHIPFKLFGHGLYYKSTRKFVIVKAYNTLYVDNSSSKADFNIKFPRKHNWEKAKLNINVNNFDLNPLGNLLKYCVNPSIKNINGVVNIQSDNDEFNMHMLNCSLIMKDSAKSMIFPKDFNINTRYKISSNLFSIDNLVVKGGKIEVDVSGSIKDFQSKTPDFDLDINMPKSDVREVALLLPPTVSSQFDVYRLKMYPFYGDIEGNLRVEGKAPEPDINGNIRITNAYLIKPIQNAKKATINLAFVDKTLNVDVDVPTGLRETIYVTGPAEIYGDKSVDLNVRSSKSVDLKLAEQVLNPLHEILRFILGPVPIMHIEGLGNINIRIVGDKKDPHIWGDFNFRQTNAFFNDLHDLVLKNASGKLSFNNQEVHFVNNTGTLFNQPFKIDGMCTLFGNIDFDITAHNQPLKELDKSIRTSPLLAPLKVLIPKIENAEGNVDLDLNLLGMIQDINHIKLNDNVHCKGCLTLKNNSMDMNNVLIKHVSGKILFDNLNVELNLNTILDDLSKINISGSVKDNIAKVAITSPRLNIREFAKEKYKELDDCWVSLEASYNGRVDNIELNKINCSVKVLKNNGPVKNIKILTGQLSLKNSNLKLKNVYGLVKQNPFFFNLEVKNIGKTSLSLRRARVNADLNIKEFDLATLNFCKYSSIFPPQIRKQLDNFKILYGNSDLSVKIRNNRINANIELNNARGVYTIPNESKEKTQVPIKLINGQIAIKNNRIFLNKMNYLVDNMPVLIYGDISNIFGTPRLNIHINSKLVQRTFDKYWNLNNIYPIKVKGDILLGSLISGPIKELNTKLTIKMEENSSIYYMGATLGDVENPIVINSDFDVLKNNVIKLNKFQYNKLISSQNNTQSVFPILTVKGGITFYNKMYKFDNLIVKTEAPTDARIFNIIFRKPTIKHGQFTSDLRINGMSTSPKILGDFAINGIDMPFLSTTVKDLSFNFDEKDIHIQSKGEVLSNDVRLNAVLKNNFSSAYKIEKADIYLKQFNLNKVLADLKQLELKTFNENQGDGNKSASSQDFRNLVTFDDLNVTADSIIVKNIKAVNLKAKCSLNDKMQLSVDNFKFDVADGSVDGHVNYNLLNNIFNLKLNTKDVNANDLTIALFDLPNQIYGKLTGTINLMSNMTNEQTSKETLTGKGSFVVAHGKMPKLGSLEYLLKAGNLVKSGFTGVSVNGIVDLITPMKTGEFSSIDGNVIINQGVAEKVEIHTRGKDLNLFIHGKYNFVTKIADMKVYGQISRKISTVLGKVGNVSINTLFNAIPGVNLCENCQLFTDLNKIPGIELNSKEYRKFVVDILGDINGENYVKSFKWIHE